MTRAADVETWNYALLFGIAAVFGLRGSVRVTRRYYDVRGQLDWREDLILVLLVAICWVITLAAGYFGVLSIRTMLGLARIPELVPLSALVATLILFTPTVIDFVVERVARVPWDGT